MKMAKDYGRNLEVNVEVLEAYVYSGQLKYIDGAWRWDKNGFRNNIVLIDTKSLGYSYGVSLEEHLRSKGNFIHLLLDK